MRRKWRRRPERLEETVALCAPGCDCHDEIVPTAVRLHATGLDVGSPFTMGADGLRVDVPIECSECGGRSWWVDVEVQEGACGTATCAVCSTAFPLYAHPV